MFAFPYHRYIHLLVFSSIFLLSACSNNSFFNAEQSLILDDTKQAEQIAKEALSAAAEAESAANDLKYAQMIGQPFQASLNHQIYSQADYNQQISVLRSAILMRIHHVVSLAPSSQKEHACADIAPFFKRLDEIIYHHPEYATPQKVLESNLNFFLNTHQVWSYHCNNAKFKPIS